MQQERESMAFKEQQAKVVEEIAKTIKSSKEVRGIPISEKEKSELIDFITNGPEGSELSHFQLALQDAPTDVHIAIAALVKRNFNLDGIIARRASTKNAEGLRSRLQSVKERVPSKGSKRSKEVVEKPDFNELDISLI
jgi:hypothetical protein